MALPFTLVYLCIVYAFKSTTCADKQEDYAATTCSKLFFESCVKSDKGEVFNCEKGLLVFYVTSPQPFEDRHYGKTA